MFFFSSDVMKVNCVDNLKCCFNNHIGECIPGNHADDSKCDDLCKQNNCVGGHCKVEGSKPPNHFCHCLC